MSGVAYPLAAEAAATLAALTGVAHHDAVVVLGSGWTDAADSFGRRVADLPVTDVPGFVAPVAQGHAGRICSFDLNGIAVLAFLGRTHLYEGHGPDAVAHAVRTAAATGCRMAVLTSANGSLRPDWATGTGVLISDHLNLSGATPLVGAQFVDLTNAWSPRLQQWALNAHPDLLRAVYVMMAGPQYQTLAETTMLRTLGADIVGMSTVLEAIAARERGMELLGLSVVATREGTNEVIDPDEVVAAAAAAATKLGAVVAAVIERWAQHVQ